MTFIGRVKEARNIDKGWPLESYRTARITVKGSLGFRDLEALVEAAKAVCEDCRDNRRLNAIWNDARKRWDFFHDDESGDNIAGCDAEEIHRLREGERK